MGAAPPLTVWFGGDYAKMSPEEQAEVAAKLTVGSEVGVYGFISGKQDISMSAASINFF